MARAPSTKKRRRGWAWTLTITAALLAVVWVGSMRALARVWVSDVCLSVSGGGLVITHVTLVGDATQFLGRRGPSGVFLTDWNAFFVFARDVLVVGDEHVTTFYIPLWPFVLLTGVPGVWMLITTRKHTNPNACPACGYDRTGLPPTSTGPAPCPECGKT